MAGPALCMGSALTIVAHTDDDLFFFNAHILHDIEAGRCTRTVFVTAGEAGEGPEYWGSLEAGIRATYAQMAGVPYDWTTEDAAVTAGAILVHTLTDAPHVSLVFLRIPDGFDGNGSAEYGWESLAKLWDGRIETITTVDAEEWYTKNEVLDILVQLMTNFEPTTVRTQDWTTDPENLDDHSDHWATAVFTQLANEQYAAPHTLLAYEGYPIWNHDQNVFGHDLTKSIDAFVTFADYDKYLCANPDEGCPGYPHDIWLARQYLVSVESTENAAREEGVTVTASSSMDTEPAENAMDGYPLGAAMGAGHEWVTNEEGVGSWIEYTFPSPTPLEGVTLFDRPNLDDQVTGATIEFSDGSSVPVGALPNNGSGLTIRFPARTVTSVRLKITSVSATTTAVGLAEFEAWRAPAG
jgi:LmbE family N-acetylglucosaminyl deacetylase